MFSINFLTEKKESLKEFNLETHLAFFDYAKAFDKLFKILQSKNTPDLLLKSIIEICYEHEIK